MKRAETRNKAAEMNTGLYMTIHQSLARWTGGETHPLAVSAEMVPVLGVVAILMSGAMNPPTRFNAEQRASPVPR